MTDNILDRDIHRLMHEVRVFLLLDTRQSLVTVISHLWSLAGVQKVTEAYFN